MIGIRPPGEPGHLRIRPPPAQLHGTSGRLISHYQRSGATVESWRRPRHRARARPAVLGCARSGDGGVPKPRTSDPLTARRSGSGGRSVGETDECCRSSMASARCPARRTAARTSPASRPSVSAVRRVGGVESISHVGGQARVVLDSGPHWTNLPSGDGSTDITSAPDTQSTTVRTTTPRDLDETEVACPACPHPRDAHDAIGTRYCTATIASGAAGRGCVCRLPG